MAPPMPDPERVARAWELHSEQGRSLRAIGQLLGISHETARQWVRQGRAAQAWLEEDARKEDYTGPEHVRAKLATFLDSLISMGRDEIDNGGATYKDVAPIMLRAAVEQARALGAYAPTRVDVTGVGPAAEPDPQTRAVVDAMQARTAERDQQLAGDS